MGRLKDIRKSLLGKLIISMMVIWIPVSAIVIAGMGMLSNRIIKETIGNQTDKISFFSAIINTDIEKVMQSTNQLCSDKAVVDFVDTWNGRVNGESYLLYVDAYNALKEYRNISLYIDDIFLYLPKTEEILSASRSIIPCEGEYLEMKQVHLEKGEHFFYYEDDLYYLSRSSNQIMTGIKVSLQEIRRTLKTFDSRKFYDYFFVHADTKELLEHPDKMDETGKAIYEAIQWDGEKMQEIRAEGNQYLVYQIGRPSNGFLIMMYLNRTDAYSSIYALYWGWFILTVLLILIPAVFSMMIRNVIKRPMDKLQKAMEMVEREKYDYRLETDESKEFNYVFVQYNRMTQKVRNLIKEVLEKQVQVEQARYKELQMQINPHFLFNSLYMGYRMAQAEDCEAVGDLCMYLGDYFSVLTFVSNDDISVENEVKFATTYLQLNRMRFGEKLQFSVKISEGIEDYRIPPLLLQPLIENAITHGMEKCMHPCRIEVQIYEEKGNLSFKVTDDSGVMTQETIDQLFEAVRQKKMPDKNFGLWNIQNRLKQLDEENEGICMAKTEEGIFVVSFRIRVKKCIV